MFLPSKQLKNVVVLANFSVANLTMIPAFSNVGTCYNLMDNTAINITDVNAAIAINAGQILIYGKKLTTLQISDIDLTIEIKLVPNPTTNYFTIDTPKSYTLNLKLA